MYQQSAYQGALQKFHQAAQSDPNNADAYYNLAATYHRLGRLHNTKPDLDQAEGYYHQCIDRNPNHQDCYRGLAVLLVEENRTQDAFQLVQNWELRNPSQPAPKIELARLYEESGNKDAAKQQLTEALSVDPNDPRAWRRWASCAKTRAKLRKRWPTISVPCRSIVISPRSRSAWPPCRRDWPLPPRRRPPMARASSPPQRSRHCNKSQFCRAGICQLIKSPQLRRFPARELTPTAPALHRA